MVTVFGNCSQHFLVRALYLDENLKYSFLKHKSINYNSPKKEDKDEMIGIQGSQDIAGKDKAQIHNITIPFGVTAKNSTLSSWRENIATTSHQLYGTYHDNTVELKNELDALECLLY